MLNKILCGLVLGFLGLFSLFCMLNPVFLGERLPPGDFYRIGTELLEKRMQNEGVEIDLREWRCGFENPEEAGFENDPETYTVFYCGTTQDDKHFAFAAGISMTGSKVWGDDNFRELVAQ